MLGAINDRLVGWLRAKTPWGPSLGLARTLLAAATLSTLLFNPTDALFRPGVGRPEFPVCDGVAAYGLFCQIPNLEVARWVAIAALAIVVSGWRPRWTGVAHWWIAASLSLNAIVIDGGEQVSAVLTMLLVPVTLTDPRANHWHRCPPLDAARQCYPRVIALSFLALAAIQVSFIYAHASIEKFAVDQWSNGTALYYWLTSGPFSAPRWLRPVIEPLVANGTALTLLTWSVLVLEYLLGAAALMPRRTRIALFWAGVAMHLGILFIQGIASFAVTMLGALVLVVWPYADRHPLQGWGRAIASALDRMRRATARRVRPQP